MLPEKDSPSQPQTGEESASQPIAENNQSLSADGGTQPVVSLSSDPQVTEPLMQATIVPQPTATDYSGTVQQPNALPFATINAATAPYAAAQVSIPPAPTVPSAAVSSSTNAPGVIVLQWLTYAFWGWTALSVIALASSVLAQLIADAETGSFTTYALAASLVLLPISIVCDLLYAKKEPAKKTGAASVVMVIHAVIFALFGIGSLISFVFACINLLTATGDSTQGLLVWILTSLFAVGIYTVLFVRTLFGTKYPLFRRFMPIGMAVLVGILALAGILGPVASQVRGRNDSLIVQNLPDISRSVDEYVQENKKLPASLDDVELSGDAKQLVDQGKVRYKTKQTSSTTLNITRSKTSEYRSTSLTKKYPFELCTTYVQEKKSSYTSYRTERTFSATSLYIYEHPAGDVCYDVESTTYDY